MKPHLRATACLILLTGLVGGCAPRVDEPADSAMPQKHPSYELPASDMPKDVQASLHPWIAGFIGLSPAEATARLHERWASLQRPSLLALRDTLSEFEVRAIVDDGAGGMIYAVRPKSDENIVGNSFYLPAALTESELTKHLKQVGLADNAALKEFMHYFGGLAEDSIAAGNFVYRETPWPTFSDSWEGSIQGFEDWKSSLMIYHALNGCHVLVHPNGKVAWWMMQEHRVAECANDFDEFIMYFSKHRKLAWPFDPYGPP